MATVNDLLDGDPFELFESGNSDDNEGLGALSYLSRGTSVTEEVAASTRLSPETIFR